MGYSYEGPQELLQLRESVRLKIGRLQTVLDALDLYELAPDVPAAAGASAVNGTGRKSASPPVINIYNSTFGALNTGEVLGSIHSNVAAVTGSPSAESFREAAEAFARLVAENRELTDENRSALLETIDIVAEEGIVLPPRFMTPAKRA